MMTSKCDISTKPSNNGKVPCSSMKISFPDYVRLIVIKVKLIRSEDVDVVALPYLNDLFANVAIFETIWGHIRACFESKLLTGYFQCSYEARLISTAEYSGS